MSATVQINEYNTSSETKTANITNSNMGSTDAANLDPVANPITPGNNSYEKWQKLEVTNMGGSSQIDTLKVWRDSALGGSASHVTNARETSYAGAETFATPTDSTSTVATETMPTSSPSGANLGIGGALDGSLTATGESDYLVHQIQTDAADTEGSTSTLKFSYREVA